jgi:hypothetical protein
MATPEGKAKAKILKHLRDTCNTHNWVLDIESHAGDAYSTPTLDITGTMAHPLIRGWGVPFAIEVKRFDGKGKTTERQHVTMQRKAAAGVAVFLIDSDDALVDFLKWIICGCPRRPSIAAK